MVQVDSLALKIIMIWEAFKGIIQLLYGSLFGLLDILIAYGLWKEKSWARTGAMIISSLYVVSSIPYIPETLGGIIIHSLILGYLILAYLKT